MAKKKIPSLAQQAEKELKRLYAAARRVEKRGYTFDLSPLTRTRGGKQRKRWTKSAVEELRRMRTADLYQYATGPGGVSGEEWRSLERQAAARKSAETRRQRKEQEETMRREEADKRAAREWEQEQRVFAPPRSSEVIIDNFLRRENWEPISNIQYDLLNDWLENEISNVGQDIVAEALEKAMNDGTVNEIRGRYKEYITTRLSKLEEYIDKEYEKFNDGERQERSESEHPPVDAQADMDAEAHTVDRFGEEQETDLYHKMFG